MADRIPKIPAGQQLPPPPAPPSRDANPWPVRGPARDPRVAGLERGPRRTVPPRRPTPPAAPPAGARGPVVRWAPLLIAGVVLLGIGISSLDSFRRGDYVGALIPLVFVGFIAAGILRSRFKGPH